MKKNVFLKITVFIILMIFVVQVFNKEEQSIEQVEDMQKINIETLKEGEGDFSKIGDTLVVHYTGTFENGEVFDSSLERGEPFEFVLGAHSVIEGWERGMLEMQKGEKRKLFVPYSFAYGEYGAPPVIPGKANLIFEVELLEIK